MHSIMRVEPVSPKIGSCYHKKLHTGKSFRFFSTTDQSRALRTLLSSEKSACTREVNLLRVEKLLAHCQTFRHAVVSMLAVGSRKRSGGLQTIVKPLHSFYFVRPLKLCINVSAWSDRSVVMSRTAPEGIGLARYPPVAALPSKYVELTKTALRSYSSKSCRHGDLTHGSNSPGLIKFFLVPNKYSSVGSRHQLINCSN
ncbi:uncharacterized protein LOC111253081 [Varroa destructor]|uniref:Uncharacterized protein n=1 Tax=Varroa destructor TaxID=109461 RepID=A0A7M7KLK7_VARDE|nr:uncharacterized protein LOC111253081 [Varroa destructor]